MQEQLCLMVSWTRQVSGNQESQNEKEKENCLTSRLEKNTHALLFSGSKESKRLIIHYRKPQDKRGSIVLEKSGGLITISDFWWKLQMP